MGFFPLQSLVDLCGKSPCKNRGTCVQTLAQTRCVCPPGWTGAYCDVPNVSCQVAASQRGKAASSVLQLKHLPRHLLPLCTCAHPTELCLQVLGDSHFSSENTLCLGVKVFLIVPITKKNQKGRIKYVVRSQSFSTTVLHNLPFWKMHQLFMLNPRQAKPQV